MRARPWTRDEVRLIYRLAADGFGRQEVADELGVPFPTLREQLRRMPRVRFRRGYAPDPMRRVEVINLVRLGHDTGSRLAAVLGMDTRSANRFAAELVAVGVLERTGKGRGRRLKVTRAWE